MNNMALSGVTRAITPPAGGAAAASIFWRFGADVAGARSGRQQQGSAVSEPAATRTNR